MNESLTQRIRNFYDEHKILCITFLCYIAAMILGFFFSPWSVSENTLMDISPGTYLMNETSQAVITKIVFFGIYDLCGAIEHFDGTNSTPETQICFLLFVIAAFSIQKMAIEHVLDNTELEGLEKISVNYFVDNAIAYLSTAIAYIIFAVNADGWSWLLHQFAANKILLVIGTIIFLAVVVFVFISMIYLLIYMNCYLFLGIFINLPIDWITSWSLPLVFEIPLLVIVSAIGAIILEAVVNFLDGLLKKIIFKIVKSIPKVFRSLVDFMGA